MNNQNSSEKQKNTQEESSSWMNHPDLSGMDASKLAMLSALAEQGSHKNSQELLPFLMSAASKSKSRGMNFSTQEMDTIIQVLKIGKPPAEVARMERMLQMLKLIR